MDLLLQLDSSLWKTFEIQLENSVLRCMRRHNQQQQFRYVNSLKNFDCTQLTMIKWRICDLFSSSAVNKKPQTNKHTRSIFASRNSIFRWWRFFRFRRQQRNFNNLLPPPEALLGNNKRSNWIYSLMIEEFSCLSSLELEALNTPTQTIKFQLKEQLKLCLLVRFNRRNSISQANGKLVRKKLIYRV